MSSLTVVLAVAVTAFIAIAEIEAAPSCASSAMLSCVMPIAVFGTSAEARELASLQATGREEDITERQVVPVCKLFQGVTTCVADYFTRCIPPDITDVHQLSRGTVKLMEVCDKPYMYTQAMIQATCTRKLKATPAMQSCKRLVETRMGYLRNRPGPDAAMELLRSGRILKDFCCVLKEVAACIEPEIQVCTHEAIESNHNTFAAILDAYGCVEKTASGCPATAHA